MRKYTVRIHEVVGGAFAVTYPSKSYEGHTVASDAAYMELGKMLTAAAVSGCPTPTIEAQADPISGILDFAIVTCVYSPAEKREVTVTVTQG